MCAGTARRHTGSVSSVFSKLYLTLLTLTLCGACYPRRDHFASLLYSRVLSFVFIPGLLIIMIFSCGNMGRLLSEISIKLLFSLVVTRKNKLNSPYCRVAGKVPRLMSFYLSILILIFWLLSFNFNLYQIFIYLNK